MRTFRDLLVDVRPVFEPSPVKEFVVAPERLGEADSVAPCVWRMAYGELDPTEALTASRTAGRGSPPSLARALGRRFASAPLSTHVALVEAIYHTTAFGYTAMIELQEAGGGHAIVDRATEDLWDFWSPRFRDPLEGASVQKKWAIQVRRLGADRLISDLKPLGLTRRFGGSTLSRLGMLYAQAGAWLRMAQTDEIGPESFAQALEATRANEGRSDRFGAYPEPGSDALASLAAAES